MQIEATNIQGCYIIEPEVHRDSRGYFMECFQRAKLEEKLGHKVQFVQDNQSISYRHVLRGLHFQKGKYAQAKLGRVIRGRALDVVADLRKDSPSFGQTFSIELSEDNNLQLYMPKGVAHGFLALEDQTVFLYKCDTYYHRESEAGVRYNDPDLAIDWGIAETDMILSEKDKALPYFKELFP